MKILIAIPEGNTSINAVSGAIAIFEKANEYCGDIFEVKIATPRPVNAIPMGRYLIKPDLVIVKTIYPDLIILPSLGTSESPETILEQNQILLDYIVKAYQSGRTQIASLCTGAYFLAATGLLDGKEVSSHWVAIEDLKEDFRSHAGRENILLRIRTGFILQEEPIQALISYCTWLRNSPGKKLRFGYPKYLKLITIENRNLHL